MYDKKLKLEERFNMPLDGLSNYRVRNGIIYTHSIEVNVVRHCNLSCRSCSHSSPISIKKCMNPSSIGKDLEKLSHYLKCKVVRVLGGEPLLHPALDEFLKEIKKSNIASRICIVTNGTLLHLVDEKIVPYIDEVQVSLYQQKYYRLEEIYRQVQRIKDVGIDVEVKEISAFRESISQIPTEDSSIINIVYNKCVIAHVWRSLTVDSGFLFRCPQSMVYAEEISNYSDAIKIYDIKNTQELLAFLENNRACGACSRCLGSIGKSFLHMQVKKEDWSAALPLIPEEGIDYEFAKKFSLK